MLPEDSFLISGRLPDETDSSESDSTVPNDVRAQQIFNLERLQAVLNETTRIRANLTILQVQVSASESGNRPARAPEEVEALSPEELEAVKAQLERTLAIYGKEVAAAAKLNQMLEREHREFSDMKMQFRLTRDERMMRHNEMAAAAMASVAIKEQRLRESWAFELGRLESITNYLRGLAEVSEKEMHEFEERYASNVKGIERLRSSIALARQDLKDFKKEREALAVQLQQFSQLVAKHQETELRVVELSNELDALRTRVEMDSLTARVKNRLEDSQGRIDGINRVIDSIQCEVARLTVQTQQSRDRTADLDARRAQVGREVREMRGVVERLSTQRAEMKANLVRCCQGADDAAGGRIVLARRVASGFARKTEPWTIRKEILALKGDIIELANVEERTREFEEGLELGSRQPVELPPRKRLPLIPILAGGA
jgi:chromosome segregation ATPase